MTLVEQKGRTIIKFISSPPHLCWICWRRIVRTDSAVHTPQNCLHMHAHDHDPNCRWVKSSSHSHNWKPTPSSLLRHPQHTFRRQWQGCLEQPTSQWVLQHWDPGYWLRHHVTSASWTVKKWAWFRTSDFCSYLERTFIWARFLERVFLLELAMTADFQLLVAGVRGQWHIYCTVARAGLGAARLEALAGLALRLEVWYVYMYGHVRVRTYMYIVPTPCAMRHITNLGGRRASLA